MSRSKPRPNHKPTPAQPPAETLRESASPAAPPASEALGCTAAARESGPPHSPDKPAEHPPAAASTGSNGASLGLWPGWTPLGTIFTIVGVGVALIPFLGGGTGPDNPAPAATSRNARSGNATGAPPGGPASPDREDSGDLVRGYMDRVAVENLIDDEPHLTWQPATEVMSRFTPDPLVTIKRRPDANPEHCRGLQAVLRLYDKHKGARALVGRKYRHDYKSVEILDDGNTAVAISHTVVSDRNKPPIPFYYQAWRFVRRPPGHHDWRIAEIHGGLTKEEALSKVAALKKSGSAASSRTMPG